MEDVEENLYRKTLTLEGDDSTYFTYIINIESNGSWYEEDEITVTLAEQPDNNGGTTNGNDDTKNTPGFELILIMLALIVTAFVYKKKIR